MSQSYRVVLSLFNIACIALFLTLDTLSSVTIITPFTSTLSSGALIKQIYALFFAEIVTTNAIQLLDPMGHINRHFLAPRAATQDAMNLKMQGAVFELAERYTNMTKSKLRNLHILSVLSMPWVDHGAHLIRAFPGLIPFLCDDAYGSSIPRPVVLCRLPRGTVHVLVRPFHQLFHGSLLAHADMEASAAARYKNQ